MSDVNVDKDIVNISKDEGISDLNIKLVRFHYNGIIKNFLFIKNNSDNSITINENLIQKIKNKIKKNYRSSDFYESSFFQDLNLVLGAPSTIIHKYKINFDIISEFPSATFNLQDSEIVCNNINMVNNEVVNVCKSKILVKNRRIDINGSSILNAYRSSIDTRVIYVSGCGVLNANLSSINSKIIVNGIKYYYSGHIDTINLNINGSAVCGDMDILNSDIYAIGSEINNSHINIKNSNLHAYYSEIKIATFDVNNSKMFIKFSRVYEDEVSISLEDSEINIFGCLFNCKNVFKDVSNSYVNLTEGATNEYQLEQYDEKTAKLLDILTYKLKKSYDGRLLKDLIFICIASATIGGLAISYKTIKNFFSTEQKNNKNTDMQGQKSGDRNL